MLVLQAALAGGPVPCEQLGGAEQHRGAGDAGALGEVREPAAQQRHPRGSRVRVLGVLLGRAPEPHRAAQQPYVLDARAAGNDDLRGVHAQFGLDLGLLAGLRIGLGALGRLRRCPRTRRGTAPPARPGRPGTPSAGPGRAAAGPPGSGDRPGRCPPSRRAAPPPHRPWSAVRGPAGVRRGGGAGRSRADGRGPRGPPPAGPGCSAGACGVLPGGVRGSGGGEFQRLGAQPGRPAQRGRRGVVGRCVGGSVGGSVGGASSGGARSGGCREGRLDGGQPAQLPRTDRPSAVGSPAARDRSRQWKASSQAARHSGA